MAGASSTMIQSGDTLAIHPGALGDVLLTIPALRALRTQSRGRTLVLASQPRLGHLLASLGLVDRAIDFESVGLGALFTAEPSRVGPGRSRAGRSRGVLVWVARFALRGQRARHRAGGRGGSPRRRRPSDLAASLSYCGRAPRRRDGEHSRAGGRADGRTAGAPRRGLGWREAIHPPESGGGEFREAVAGPGVCRGHARPPTHDSASRRRALGSGRRRGGLGPSGRDRPGSDRAQGTATADPCRCAGRGGALCGQRLRHQSPGRRSRGAERRALHPGLAGVAPVGTAHARPRGVDAGHRRAAELGRSSTRPARRWRRLHP
jgi:hypothetical protein